MLSLRRRHTHKCSGGYGVNDSKSTKCNCVIHCYGSIGGECIRTSLRTRDWKEASRVVLEAESRGWWKTPRTNSGASKTIEDAIAIFMADAKSDKGRSLRHSTVEKYSTLLEKRLCKFAKDRALVGINELTPEHIRDFRDTWQVSPRSCANYLNSLRCFFRFCTENEWVPKSPAIAVKPPKVIRGEEHQKKPFTDSEVEQIVNAAGAVNRELQTFILLLRHAGLRLSDATFLRKGQVAGHTLAITTIKTRSSVMLPIPAWLADRLNEIEPKSSDGHLFTDNQLALGPATDQWRRRIKPILKALGIIGKTPHCFRHTFATDLLSRGIDLTLVSKMLTHSSTTITEKFYAPWVKSRQERLESEMQRIWNLDMPEAA